jgi:hypothetical protein
VTRAGNLQAIYILHRERAEDLRNLGPKPPWWHPFARRAWMQERAEIGAFYFAIAKDMAEQHGVTISDLALEHVWS